MRVALDVRLIENSGIGTTIRGLLDHLRPSQRKQLVLLSSPGWKNPYECPTVPVEYKVYGLSQHWGYAAFLRKLDVDLFHMPHYDVPLRFRGPFIATVHDLIHYLFPEYSTKPLTRLYSRVLLNHVARHAARIIAVSENTHVDLVKHFPRAAGRVSVINPAVDDQMCRPDGGALDAFLAQRNLRSGYLLYVGNLRPSKNTRRLLEAYELYQNNAARPYPLVLIGRNTYGASLRIPPGVTHFDFVPWEHLRFYYSGASAFVFPSIYEGFGLPPLEAMACGTPVIASTTSSLPEVCGRAARYVNPDSASDIATAMADVAEQASLRGDLVRLGYENVRRFSWESFAQKTFELYERVASAGSRHA